MTESPELHQKVDKILQRVESMDNFMPWLVRHQVPAIRQEFMEFFKKKKRTAKVYLAIVGEKTISQIVTETSIAQPNVSAEIRTLTEYGLIDTIVEGKNTICKKNKIDKLLGLSKELEKSLKKYNPKEDKNYVAESGDTSPVTNTQSDQ